MTRRLTLAPQAGVNADLTAESGRRLIAGLVIPWGVYGRTSLGNLRANSGALRLPLELSRVKLFGLGHDRETPVGYAIRADQAPDGLRMTFLIANTPAGDRALAEASSRVRDAFSVELDGVEVEGDDIVSADLTGVAMVAVPAWADARIESVAASSPPPEVSAMPPTDTAQPVEPVEPVQPVEPVEPDEDDDDDDDDETETTTTTTTTQDRVIHAAAPRGITAGGGKRRRSLRTLYAAQVAMATDQRMTPELTAALADITHSANPWVSPDQYEGELWSGVQYARQIVPLLTQRPLTSYKVRGWRWKVKPVVADYAGDKAEVPTNPASTEEATTTAARLAGAHDIDRVYRDFGDVAFFEAYYQAMAESWALQSDTKAATFLIGSATLLPGAPTDLITAVTTASLKIQADTGSPATFALVSPTDWLELMLTKALDLPGFMSLLPIAPGNFKPSQFVPAGQAIVGAKGAVSWYEREGSPIRVETVDLAHGGIDGGVFGYYATLLNDARGLVSAAVAAPAAAEASAPASSRSDRSS